jgi:3-hydroxyisobutyrate dehydrogenase-like beta-hydroxyacid dehydrogenase
MKEFSLSGPASLPTFSFLGIGLMGKPMAPRLLQAGYPLTASNRTAAKAHSLAAMGAGGRLSRPIPRMVGAQQPVEIIITMLEAVRITPPRKMA